MKKCLLIYLLLQALPCFAQPIIQNDPTEPCGPPRPDYWLGRHDRLSPMRGEVGEGSKPRQAAKSFTAAALDSYSFFSNIRVNDNPPGSSFETPYSSGSHAMAARGDTVYLVWRSDRNTNSTIYFDKSTDGGNTWGTDVRITDSDSAAIMPALAVGQDGTIYVSWTDFRDYYATDRHIYFAKSINGGTSFLPSVRVCNDHEAYQAFSSIAVNDSGLIFVAWEDGRNSATQKLDVYCARSVDGGASFLSSVRVDDTGTDSSGQGGGIAVKDSCVFIAFNDYRYDYNYRNIYFAKSTNNGQSFDTNILVNDTTGQVNRTQRYPSICVDMLGIYMAWADDRNGDFDIYFTKSTDGGLTFTSPNINLIDAAGESYAQGYPSLACDDSGGVYCAWEDRRNGLTYPWLIYFNYSKNHGDAFATNNMHVDDRTLSEDVRLWNVTICANNKGKVFAAWSDDRNGGDYDIYTTAGNFTGVEGEPPQSISVGAASIKCYPNPFKSRITMSYTLKDRSPISVTVYNIKGELVKTIDKRFQAAGQYKLTWDGRNETGAIVSGGIYFIQLSTDNKIQTQKIIYIK